MNPKQVTDLLVEQGVVDPSQVEDIMQEVAQSGKTIVQALVDFGFLTEEQFYHTLAEALGTDYVDLKDFDPPQETLRLIPAGLARLHGAVPIALNGETITIALVDPLNPQIAEDLDLLLGGKSTSWSRRFIRSRT